MSMAYYPNAPLPNTNARQESITIRPASTALLTIDSEDRYKSYVEARDKPTSPYNFTISKSESLMNGFFTRLAVSEINFPWTIPNINAKTNKIIIQYSTGGPLQVQGIQLDTGFYKPYELAIELENYIQNVVGIPSFQMRYGVGGVPVFSYTCANPNTVSFQPMAYNSTQYPYPPQTKQLFDLLGFTQINQEQSSTTSQLGSFTYCQAIRYIDVVCNQLTSVASVKDQTSQTIARDMLCRVYLGDGGGTGQSTTGASAIDISGITNAFCPPGCAPRTIGRAFPHPKQIAWIPNQNIPGFLQFQIYDDAGDLLDNSILNYELITGQFIGESTNWSMSLLVSEN